MSRPRYLTKSRFKLAVECPTKLYYTGKPERWANTQADDAFLAALADGGFQVGELAKLMFPGGIEVTATGNAAALARTAELLRQDRVTLFEAAVAHGPFLVRVDILRKDGEAIDLIEVTRVRHLRPVLTPSSAPEASGIKDLAMVMPSGV